jgi:hypothetical protein
MKPLLTTFATILLCVGVSACGSSGRDSSRDASKPASPTGVAVTSGATHKNDRDNDGDNNDDDQHVLNFGQTASPADRQAIAALVTRYFAAAASENGKQACALLVPFIAESVVEKYGQTTPRLRGKTCAVVMSKLFKYSHRELVNKDATLQIMRVGVEGDRSLVVLNFPTIPEVRQITARRTGGSWRILYLLDGILE